MSKKIKETGCAEYDILVKGIEDAKEQVRSAGKKAVTALFKKLFEDFPSIKAVGWTQYTPYFNDGEPCEFGLGEPYVCKSDGVDFAEVRSLYDEDVFKDKYSLDGNDAEAKAAIRWIERAALSEVFESAFGDHVMVIATPDGFHVSEYDHD